MKYRDFRVRVVLYVGTVIFACLFASKNTVAQIGGGPGLDTHGEGSITSIRLFVKGVEDPNNPANFKDGDKLNVKVKASIANNENSPPYSVRFVLHIELWKYHHASGLPMGSVADFKGTSIISLGPGESDANFTAELEGGKAETADPETPWPGGFEVRVTLKSFRIEGQDLLGGETLDENLDGYLFKRLRGY